MNFQSLARLLAAACLLGIDASALPGPITQGSSSRLGAVGAPLMGAKGGPDCNDNGIRDDQDIASGFSQDCNDDGIPDECPVCPPVDVVFIMDTSGSMNDEADALCDSIGQVVTDLSAQGIEVNSAILGITKVDFGCLRDYVENMLGGSVPGTPPPGEEFLDDNEDWGPATAIVADRYPWTPGAVRVIVPISDEAPEDGDGELAACDQEDADSLANAINLAVANDVIVSPISGTGSDQCVIDLASEIAVATGGTSFISTDPDQDLAGAITLLITDACSDVNDCNDNGIPDECDPDGNDNGIPDDCEEGTDLDCSETNRYEDLTPNDTLSVVTGYHNPNPEQGYLRVVAVDENLRPVGFDHLIGQTVIMDGFETMEYSVNAVDYRSAVDPGLKTDVDADGIRDLNGIEYEQTAGKILIPRFFGQGDYSNSKLLLIGLSGGRKFDTTIEFIITNDNEVSFSTEYTFRCWDKVSLKSISLLFENEFLANLQGNDTDEDIGGVETGWISMDGGVATSSAASISDPAFYAVYIERLKTYSAASLPFEACTQSGHLLSNSLFGDNEEVAGESPQDCDVSIPRRRAGSLLLYPEYDNLSGVITVVTVTNTSLNQSIKAHFVYVARFGL
jgi:hypothetical protein